MGANLIEMQGTAGGAGEAARAPQGGRGQVIAASQGTTRNCGAGRYKFEVFACVFSCPWKGDQHRRPE